MNWKKFVRVGSHIFCQSFKKGSCRLVERNAPKIRSRYFETHLWHRDRWMNRGFTRMSPKINSSRLYGCFELSHIQQKLLPHEALPSKWSPVFSEKLDMSHRTTRTTQNSQFWVVHNHLFASCLPRNQENQPLKTYHSSFLSTQNIDLMSPNDFFLFPYVNKWEVNIFRQLKKWLMRSEYMF